MKNQKGNPMRKLLLSCVLTTLSVLALPAAAYQSEEVIVEHNEVADNIYMQKKLPPKLRS
jgi:putative cell wall-binding protein